MQEIVVVPRFIVSEHKLEQAEFYCQNIDENDVAYVALSIQLGFPLVTRDKLLFTGLRKKGFRDILLFDDFMQRF